LDDDQDLPNQTIPDFPQVTLSNFTQPICIDDDEMEDCSESHANARTSVASSSSPSDAQIVIDGHDDGALFSRHLLRPISSHRNNTIDIEDSDVENM
jgi:hypothetical protein